MQPCLSPLIHSPYCFFLAFKAHVHRAESYSLRPLPLPMRTQPFETQNRADLQDRSALHFVVNDKPRRPYILLPSRAMTVESIVPLGSTTTDVKSPRNALMSSSKAMYRVTS
jgi:hypothetical protein